MRARTDRTHDERITVRLPAAHLDAIDHRVKAGEYANRSEAIRTALNRVMRKRTSKDDSLDGK